jgi:cytochrome c oxidase assembly protein subunit 15
VPRGTGTPGREVEGGAGPPAGVIAFDPWRFRLGLLTVAMTLLLIFIGGLVTSTDSGLSVPDWPLSYGMLMPPMVGGVFFEHGHRMAASFVGLLTLVLAVWTSLRETRRNVRLLAWAALAVVIAQGVLGGLTVLFLLPRAVSVAHACLAQTFFCLVIALAFSLSREWLEAPTQGVDSGLRTTTLTLFVLVYLQLVLGAVMRHLEARNWEGGHLAIPDFPLAFGRVIPPLDSLPVAVHFAHRVTALIILATAGLLFAQCRRARPYTRTGAVLLALVALQCVLGATTVLSGKAVLPTTLHVATGGAVLGTSFLLCLRVFRQPRSRVSAALPSLAEVPSHP